MKIYFFLDRRKVNKRKKSLSILANVKYTVSDQETVFRFSTGLSCSPASFRNQTVFGSDPNAEEKNTLLKKIRATAEDLYLNGIATGIIKGPQALKAAILSKLTAAEVETSTLQHLDAYIEFLQLKKKSKSYISGMRKLKAFLLELEIKGMSLHFDSIKADFEIQMLKYLAEKGFAPNTVGSYVKRLKIFLNWCLKRNLTTNLIYKNFEITQEAGEVIALSETEVESISNLNIPAHKHIYEGGTKLIRDWFIISTQTGLRYSDFKKLADAKLIPVTGGYDIHIKTQKTKAEVVIPVSRLLYKYLKEHEFNVPLPPSNQKYNKGLERIQKLAKITKKITSHTGRKSFCTIQYRKGVPVNQIMKISGHKTEKEFYKYIGVSLSENAAMVRQNNPDFQISHMTA